MADQFQAPDGQLFRDEGAYLLWQEEQRRKQQRLFNRGAAVAIFGFILGLFAPRWWMFRDTTYPNVGAPPQAIVVLTAPDDIVVGQEAKVSLVVHRDPATLRELSSNVPPEFVLVDGVQVSDRMTAQLQATSFQSERIGPEVQAVQGVGPGEWSWSVRSTTTGVSVFRVSLSALLDVQGHDAAKLLRTFEKKVSVTQTRLERTQNFFVDNWAWFASAAMPVIGFLFLRWEKKKKATKASPLKGSS